VNASLFVVIEQNRKKKLTRECCLILSGRWRILHTSIGVSTETATSVLKLCCVLQNYILSRKPVGSIAENLVWTQTNVDPAQPRGRTNHEVYRSKLVEWVMSTGSVAWQAESAGVSMNKS
jgi:hypothetical protein